MKLIYLKSDKVRSRGKAFDYGSAGSGFEFQRAFNLINQFELFHNKFIIKKTYLLNATIQN